MFGRGVVVCDLDRSRPTVCSATAAIAGAETTVRGDNSRARAADRRPGATDRERKNGSGGAEGRHSTDTFVRATVRTARAVSRLGFKLPGPGLSTAWETKRKLT